MCERGGNCGQMQHSNSFFSSFTHHFNLIFCLLMRSCWLGWARLPSIAWVIAHNFLSTSDLHQIFFFSNSLLFKSPSPFPPPPQISPSPPPLSSPPLLLAQQDSFWMLIIGTVSPTTKKKKKKGTRQKGSMSLKEAVLSLWSQTPRCLLPSRQLTSCPSQLPVFPKRLQLALLTLLPGPACSWQGFRWSLIPLHWGWGKHYPGQWKELEPWDDVRKCETALRLCRLRMSPSLGRKFAGRAWPVPLRLPPGMVINLKL